MALVTSLLVSYSNLAKLWLVRSIGEAEYAALLLRAAKRGKLRLALGGLLFSCFFVLLAAAILMFLAPNPEQDGGYWFAVGMMIYGIAILIHGSIAYRNLYRKARRIAAEEARQVMETTSHDPCN